MVDAPQKRKAESRKPSGRSTPALLGARHGRHDDLQELLDLCLQGRQSFRPHEFRLGQQVTPESQFIEFLFDEPEFGDEFPIRSGTRCFPEIRGDARA
jgi:hypothetical protein